MEAWCETSTFINYHVNPSIFMKHVLPSVFNAKPRFPIGYTSTNGGIFHVYVSLQECNFDC